MNVSLFQLRVEQKDKMKKIRANILTEVMVSNQQYVIQKSRRLNLSLKIHVNQLKHNDFFLGGGR